MAGFVPSTSEQPTQQELTINMLRQLIIRAQEVELNIRSGGRLPSQIAQESLLTTLHHLNTLQQLHRAQAPKVKAVQKPTRAAKVGKKEKPNGK